MSETWKIIVASSSEYHLDMEEPDGWYSARVKWDGCVEFYRYHNSPKGADPNENMIDYLHICNVDEEIARLQALKRVAYNYFSKYGRAVHNWTAETVEGFVGTTVIEDQGKAISAPREGGIMSSEHDKELTTHIEVSEEQKERLRGHLKLMEQADFHLFDYLAIIHPPEGLCSNGPFTLLSQAGDRQTYRCEACGTTLLRRASVSQKDWQHYKPGYEPREGA